MREILTKRSVFWSNRLNFTIITRLRPSFIDSILSEALPHSSNQRQLLLSQLMNPSEQEYLSQSLKSLHQRRLRSLKRSSSVKTTTKCWAWQRMSRKKTWREHIKRSVWRCTQTRTMLLMPTRPSSESIKPCQYSLIHLSVDSMTNWVALLPSRSEKIIRLVVATLGSGTDTFRMQNLHRLKSSLNSCSLGKGPVAEAEIWGNSSSIDKDTKAMTPRRI